jgi:hypothetical protein
MPGLASCKDVLAAKPAEKNGYETSYALLNMSKKQSQLPL